MFAQIVLSIISVVFLRGRGQYDVGSGREDDGSCPNKYSIESGTSICQISWRRTHPIEEERTMYPSRENVKNRGNFTRLPEVPIIYNIVILVYGQ